jgi:pyridoxal phosphate enzyme (YggS family)
LDIGHRKGSLLSNVVGDGYLTDVANPVRDIMAKNLRRIEERTTAACQRANRAPSEVTLVAVTKTVSPEIAGSMVELGVGDLGESRPQELWKKAAVVKGAHWHLIGHLQRNKIEQTLPHIHLIHSIDSFRLLTAIDESADRLGRAVEALLEFNLSREPQKHGFTVDDLAAITTALRELKSIRIRGLMTMAALSDDAEHSRPVFRELRNLRDQMRDTVSQPHALDHLSMGMSQDYEVAIEEGATLIRVGSALFDGI